MQISFYSINEDLSVLDDFCIINELGLYKHKRRKYNIKDLQKFDNLFIDNINFKECIKVILDKARDYLIEEDYNTTDVDDFTTSEEYINYYLEMANEYNNIYKKYFRVKDKLLNNLVKELKILSKEWSCL